MSEETDRRLFLRAAGALGIAGVSGCLRLGNQDEESTDTATSTGVETATGGAVTDSAAGESETTEEPAVDEEATTEETAADEEETAEEEDKSDCSPRTVSSNITEDTTWDTETCPRIELDGNIKVRNGATLTIQPGVEIIGTSAAKLTIKSDGTLKATGEPGNPVWFYGGAKVKGYWETIEIESNRANELSNVKVQDAGGGDWAGVWVRGSGRLSVENSTFTNNDTWGLVAEKGATLPTFSNNAFTSNGTAPVSVSSTVLGALDAASTYTGNDGDDRIEVEAHDVSSEATWAATDASFFIKGNCRLFAPITVDPGANFTFQDGGQLTVKGDGASLTADASGSETITFEGAAATPGYWEGIEVETNNPKNVLNNVEIAHGGSGDWAGVWVRGSGRLSVKNSTITNSSTWGIVIEKGAAIPSFSNNELTNNQTAPLNVSSTVVGALDAASTYTGNGNDRIEVEAHDVSSEATWAATDAPYYILGNCRLFAPITIEPSAHLTFQSGGQLTVKGDGASLTADASSGETITFEGATKVPGYWEGIEFETNNPSNLLDNIDIAHGGSGDWANIWVRGSAQLTIQNSTIRDSSTYGIVVESGAAFTESNNTYQNNADGTVNNR
jgi:hypothetical protein